MPLLDPSAQETVGGRLHDLEIGDRRFAQSFDLFERSMGAAITSAKEPNLSMNAFASGFTSRRCMARNGISSSIS